MKPLGPLCRPAYAGTGTPVGERPDTSMEEKLAPEPEPLLRRPMPRLLLASASALFLELAFIRWGGAHVLYLSYVSNFILISCFLGLGLGCLIAGRVGADRVGKLVASVPVLLLALVLTVALVDVEVIINSPDSLFFRVENAPVALPAWLALPVLGALVTAVFTAIGTAVGRELGRAKPLRAYSFDISGSMVGILLFAGTSFLQLPAHLWFLLAGLAWLPLLPARRLALYISAPALALTLAAVAWADVGCVWSPYYRASVYELQPAAARGPGDPTAGSRRYRLRVNNITHQYISDFRVREPFYEFPYRARGVTPPGLPPDSYLVNPPGRVSKLPPSQSPAWNGRVLIIGAGNGTDTAFALGYGTGHIDAVEIDPLLADFGRQLHPNQPYNDARVSLHIEDGRTFLERSHEKYDLIIYGLPDSLTLASPYAGLRLESFLFTSECFRRARELLEPHHGLLVLYNYYREPWLLQRIAATLGDAFGRPPLVLYGPDRSLSAAFFAGPGLEAVPKALGAEWGFRQLALQAGTAATQDNWPFPYLLRPSLPTHLTTGMSVMVLFALACVALVLRATRRRVRLAAVGDASATPRKVVAAVAPFFFMGVAFLLLETVGLVRMSLLFGTTWFVNALVFFAVLGMVLLANLTAARLPLRRGPLLFGALFVALALAWSLSPSAMASWPPLARYLGATFLLFVPIFLANLIFSRAFRETGFPTLAFGANLVGAVLGGVLENLALLLGFQVLYIVAALLYAAAALSARKAAPAAVAAPVGQPQ